jgi:hypothetical protein
MDEPLEAEMMQLFPWLVDWDEPTRLCPSLRGLSAEDALTVLLDKGEAKPANWLRHRMGYRLSSARRAEEFSSVPSHLSREPVDRRTQHPGGRRNNDSEDDGA